MQSLQIFLIEGNAHLRGLLSWQLEQKGHKVYALSSPQETRELLLRQSAHLLVIDADLPNQAGLELCIWAHQRFNLSILLLSTRSSETHVIAGFQAGADDYLIKPLSMQVFATRIETLARRLRRGILPSQLQFGDLIINLVHRRVMLAQQAINLTPQEFSLLFVLVQAAGYPLSRTELLQRAWADTHHNPRTVDTHILSLRKKLEHDPRQPRRIQTIRNVGYQFCPDPASSAQPESSLTPLTLGSSRSSLTANA